MQEAMAHRKVEDYTVWMSQLSSDAITAFIAAGSLFGGYVSTTDRKA